jgi:hypothetical protein
MSTSLIVSHGCDFCVAFCRYSSKAGSVKKLYPVNKNIVNSIDDIFLENGIQNRNRCRICYYSHYITYVGLYILYDLFLLFLFQVRLDLGIADDVWQDKRAGIAPSVEALGDKFRPAMRAGWLKYIQTAYAAGNASTATSSIG